MKTRKGIFATPSKPELKPLASDEVSAINPPVNKDLKVGGTYKGLPIVAETKELYVCKHKSGYKECFQKKEHRLNLKDGFHYA